MKIMIEIPDDRAEEAREAIRKIARGKESPMLAIGAPGIGSPVSDVWFSARIVSIGTRK